MGRARRGWLALVTALVALVAGGGVAMGLGDVTDPDTIVAVEGDAANGFGIHYYDGSSIYPPTDSEAAAECGEYDTLRARVRCRTKVRTWYRDLADLKQALEWAHAQ